MPFGVVVVNIHGFLKAAALTDRVSVPLPGAIEVGAEMIGAAHAATRASAKALTSIASHRLLGKNPNEASAASARRSH
jgi:hypothetical protein